MTEWDTTTVAQVARCLQGGGVVLLPTDTVYGLAALPTFPQSIERIYALKGRPKDANLPVMLASEDAIESLGVDINDTARRLLHSDLVPGALTLVMGFRGASVPEWLKGRVEVALRIPDDHLLLAILQRTGPALVTSANAHGACTPERLAEVLAQLEGTPDLAIDGGVLQSVPSTLVNCRFEPPVIEREGAISAEEIMERLA